jgi:hypothetical protein
MTREGDELIAKVDALVALPTPAPDAVGSILGATPKMGRRSELFEFVFTQGTVAASNLRFYKDVNAGILSLELRLEPGLFQKDIQLSKYGRLPPAKPNPHVQPEGVSSYTFTPLQGIKLSFQFTSKTSRLYMVVVDWARESTRLSRAN